MRVLVTGGLGFIGSAFIRRIAGQHEIVNLDADTYAGDVRRLDGTAVVTERLDIASEETTGVIARVEPEVIVHCAAETHVTRSESSAALFYRTNVDGTRAVLDAASAVRPKIVVHVSTDEVYGPALEHPFGESDKDPGEGRATSAYARSKAVADDLARSYSDRLPIIVVRPTNCFGPWQHPEKAVARWAIRALSGERLPVWGDGRYVRDWMYVDDACDALWTVIEQGRPGETYNLGPQGEVRTNQEIATAIARAAGRREDAVYLTAYDRPQHDRRYSVDATKLRELGWTPSQSIDARLGQTVSWYRDHREWWGPLIADAEAIYEDTRPREDA